MLWMELEPGGGGGGEMDMLRFFIMPAQTYTIGRRGCRLSLPNGDPSISRQHAILRTTAISPSATIAAPAAPRTSSSSSSTAATTPEEVVELYLTDGSKHGSFLNGERMQRDEEVRVDDGALMRFGTRATARMSRSMMIVFAVAAELLPRELEIIVAAATRIGAHVMMQANNTVVDPRTLEEMGWRCVGLFFFCGDGFEVDGAVLDAMSYGYTLASPACAPRMAEHLASSPLVVSGAALVPSEAPRPASMALRQSTYQPPRSCTTFADVFPAGTAATTTTTTSSSSSFASNPQQLLAGYRFLLVDGSVMARYRLLIHRLGGCVLAATEVRAEMWPSMASDPQTCVLLDKDDFRRGMEVIVSRRMEVMGFSTDHPDPLISAYLQLYKHGLCLVSEENLHIVLYRADGGELCRVGGVGHLKRRRAASLTGSFRVAPAEAESFQRTSSPRQNTTTQSSSSTWKNEDDAREQAGPASSSPLRCSPSPDQPTNSTKEANAREETSLAAPVPKASNKNNKMKMDRWAVFQQSQRLCRASLERSAGGARAAASTGRDAAITAKKAGRRRLASSESVPPTTTAAMDGPLSTNSSSSLHGSSDAELGSRGSTTENGRAGGGRRPGAASASASPPTTTDSYAPLSFGFRRETSDPRGGPPHTVEVIPFRRTHSNNINANNNGVHTDATEVGDCDPHVKDLHELSEPLLSGDEENGGEEARSTPQTQVRRPHFVGSSSKWLRQPSMDAGVPAHESASRQSSQDRVVRTNNNNNNTHKDLIASVRAAAAASSAQVAPSTVMTSSRPRLGAASVEPRHRPSNNNNNNKSTPMYEGRLSGSRAASTIASRPLAGGRRPPTVIQRSVLHSRSESVVSATGSLTFSRSSTAPRSRPQTSSAAAAGGARPPSSMAMDVYFARALTSFPNTLERT